jgi:hypothetical protein
MSRHCAKKNSASGSPGWKQTQDRNEYRWRCDKGAYNFVKWLSTKDLHSEITQSGFCGWSFIPYVDVNLQVFLDYGLQKSLLQNILLGLSGPVTCSRTSCFRFPSSRNSGFFHRTMLDNPASCHQPGGPYPRLCVPPIILPRTWSPIRGDLMLAELGYRFLAFVNKEKYSD